MTSLKHSPMRQVSALLILLTIATIGALAKTVSKGIASNSTDLSTSLQDSGAAKSEPRLATREELVRLGNALAKCPKSPQPCSNIFGATEIASWIQSSSWRADGREGNPKLSFDDFTGFHRKFGNALARLVSQDIIGEIVNMWVLNESADNDRCHTIVVDHLVGYDAASTEVYEGPDERETSVDNYAKALAILMSHNFDGKEGNGKVGVNDFVNFMLRKQ